MFFTSRGATSVRSTPVRSGVATLLVLAACSFRHGNAVSDGSVGVDASDASGGDGSGSSAGYWQIDLTITNGATTMLATGFQIGFAIDLDSAPCNGDRDHVHVWWHGGDVTRTFDELGSGNEWAWFPLQAPIAAGATSTEYSVTCLDPARAPSSDPTMVFDFVEPFANLDQWTTQRSPTVSAGVVTLPANDGTILSMTQWAPDHAVDFWLRVGDAAANDVWGGWQDQVADQRPWLIWYTFNTPNKIYPSFCDATANPCTNGPTAAVTQQPLDTAWHFYGVENCGDTTAQWRLANVVVQTMALANYTGSHRVRLDNFNTNAAVEARDLRVRQAACPLPTVVVGSPVMR